jgi:hypothetical protein
MRNRVADLLAYIADREEASSFVSVVAMRARSMQFACRHLSGPPEVLLVTPRHFTRGQVQNF